MGTPTTGADQNDARALRHELRQADDEKIRRITAMLDTVSNTADKQAILDPLRARLRSIKPARPLRFSRLLFTPMDPLIRPAAQWQPDQATVPRTILQPMSNVVRAALGPDAASIDAALAGHTAEATQVITEAGAMLWPRAAEILTASAPPAEWSETGLPATLYSPLVKAVGAVLRRAPQLRCLLRDGEVAALEANQRTIRDILRDIANEPATGQAMIAQLILLQSPHAAPLLRQFATASHDKAEAILLHQAMTRGTEQALTQIERDVGSINELRDAPLAGVGEQVRRITALLEEVGRENGVATHRPRLKAIREKLDATCRARFADGLAEGLVQPLAEAPGPLDRAGQTQLENCVRDLRTLETTVRKIGGSETYDALLRQASETVRSAAQAGTLTPMRQLRLIELLSGPEAATAIYRETTARL